MNRPCPLLFVCLAWNVAAIAGAEPGEGRWIVIKRLPAGPHAGGEDHVAATKAKIENTLDRLITVDADKVPLDRWLDELARRECLNIVLDQKSLHDVGLDAQIAEVTIRLRDIPMRSALSLVLRQFDLAWIIDNEVMLVTTPEEANRESTRLYNVTELIPGPAGDRGRDFEPLFEAIVSTVAPTTWEFSGPVPIPVVVVPGADLAIIDQVQDVHREIDGFLRQLRAVVRKKDDRRPRTVSLPTTVAKIERALDRRVTAHYHGPLDAVLRQIESHSGINVLPDARALQDVAISLTDVRVDFHARNVPIRQVLDEILKSANQNPAKAPRDAGSGEDSLGLTFTLRDDVVLVTSLEEVRSNMLVRVYDVTDLIPGDPADGEPALSPYDLVTAIEKDVLPDRWASNGGPGSICLLQLPGAVALAVSQTYHVHRELAARLARLRAASK
jgi:hypothetical protein